MKTFLPRRTGLAMAALAAALALPAAAQQTSAPAKTNAAEGEYSMLDVTLFGGGQWFNLGNTNKANNFAPGGIFGVRFAQEFSRYIGLEQTYQMGWNNGRVQTTQPFATQRVGFGVRNHMFAIAPVFHFTPRESKIRPFVMAGPALMIYDPTTNAEANGNSSLNAVYGMQGMEAKYGPALNYGGGVKFNMWPRVALRFDLRGLWSQTPHFNISNVPGPAGRAWIPTGGSEHALQATAGVTFRFGRVAPPPPPVKVEPPPPAVELNVGAITGGRPVCPGESLTLAVTADVKNFSGTPTYAWTVNGNPVGGNSNSITLDTKGRTGVQRVAVNVTAGSVRRSAETSVQLKQYALPTVSLSASPSTIEQGATSQLSATPKGSECSGNIRLSYAASEGSISGNTFNSSNVAFDMSNRNKVQTKNVTVTATATDEKGGTGSARTDITVTLKPVARRLDDIIFPNLSSRVNNCAKRLLLEVLTPLLRDDPNGKVVLIGHRDEKETGKRNANLDEKRVLNAAAVLSAGTGICPSLELSRVQGNWVGTSQSSQTRPNLCGASTNVRERSNSRIREKDTRSQYRRVEIWFIPGGAEMPAEAAGAKDLPAAEVKKLGCPK